ncbi:outer membrane beta-barrel protein [Urechidicola vernalis]|uniref:Long-chain fatty acid transport protein n=1 Tax=Urechidicola vernalis TaxID=3075600 RepID=A0ABU2Y3R5_9FLAO|nr:outer membrane beta-barrel protein [Urechidicola sp. P050]MDT0552849.1 hypothetical protein [Urechidicola sp. P050]
MIKRILVLLVVLFSIQSFSQQTSSSPYSGLGIGDDSPQKTVEEMSMGGVGVSNNNRFNLNFNNPASFAALSFTTYTLAGENRAYSFEDDNGKDKSSNAYLSYIAVGIPMGPKGGFAFGFQPKTTTGYNITNTIYNDDDEPLQASLYEGKGGTNSVFLGAGYEVFKGLSIGLEGEYIFGNVENSILNQIKDVQLGTKYRSISDVEGFEFELGAIYHKKLEKNLYFNVGAKLELESNLDSKGNEYLYSVNVTSIEIPRDTIWSETSRGVFTTPLKTSVGFNVGKTNKWSAGIDYSFRNAIDATGNLESYNPQVAYQEANNLAVGGFYIPRYNSISSYWHRVIYRWGFNMEKTGLMVDAIGDGANYEPVDKVGMSFGVGIPVGGELSRLNLGFEFGQRGSTNNGLVKENYFNFRLGLTLQNKWFKPKQIY